jgi:hypothetical protein
MMDEYRESKKVQGVTEATLYELLLHYGILSV